MGRKLDRPVERTLIAFYEGDIETLKQFYPPPVGYNTAVRELIHRHANKLREKSSRAGVNTHDLDIDLDISDLLPGAGGGGANSSDG